jgi:hypothetical protein
MNLVSRVYDRQVVLLSKGDPNSASISYRPARSTSRAANHASRRGSHYPGLMAREKTRHPSNDPLPTCMACFALRLPIMLLEVTHSAGRRCQIM